MLIDNFKDISEWLDIREIDYSWYNIQHIHYFLCPNRTNVTVDFNLSKTIVSNTVNKPMYVC